MTFYIQELTATGQGKTPATVTFTQGLNIICGVSDSGKSGILKAIFFLMGGTKPFDAGKTGYSKIELTVATPNGKISLSRQIGKNVIDVSSQNPTIQSGFYDVDKKYKVPNKNPLISDLWLKLIGIDPAPLVIKNKNYERVSLTWKSISNLFWLREQDIENPKSILLSMDNTAQTAFLSSFIYLLTGKDFAETEAHDTDRISAAKRNALQGFVDAQTGNMSQREREIKKTLSEIEKVDVESEVENLLNSLAETEQSIMAASDENKEIINQLTTLHERETESQLVKAQFRDLKSQYTSDIKRLTFIVEGDKHHHDLEDTTECPFCAAPLSQEKRESVLETSKAELARIILQLQGLTESEADVSAELSETKNKIKALEQRRDELDKLIESELTPYAAEIKETIQHYRSSVELKRELELMQELSRTWATELQKEVDEDEKKVEFYPRKHFPDDFNREIDRIALAILKECRYENLHEAHFNMSTFDLEINRLVKEDNHGKGYWAFINTVLGLTIRKYVADVAKYKLGLFVVDTPLLGLDQGVENASESMRNSLFNYFIAHQDEGQMIVVENKKDLPRLDYVEKGVNVIEFTHDKYVSEFSNNRYGFLYDVFDESGEG